MGGTRQVGDAPAEAQPGFWELLRRVLHGVGEKNLSHIAAGVAFYMLLSIFPAIAVGVAAMGLAFDPNDAEPLLETLRPLLPSEGYAMLEAQVEATLSTGGARLGATAILSFVVSFWAAGAAVRGMMSAMSLAFPDAGSLSILRFYGLSLVFTALAILLAIAAALVLVLLPVAFEALRRLPLEEWFAGTWFAVDDLSISALELPVLIVLFAATLTLVYRIGAARGRGAWRAAFAGAAFATLAWIAASRLLSLYVSSFGDLDVTYGPLGAVVGLMLWFWISALLVLVGAEFARVFAAGRRASPG